jgi:Ca2+-binding EF-hand superfamily protein
MSIKQGDTYIRNRSNQSTRSFIAKMASENVAALPSARLTSLGRMLMNTYTFDAVVHLAFGASDGNRSGLVNQEEMFAGMLFLHLTLAKHVGPAALNPPSRKVLNAMFEEADADNSGRLGKQQFREIMSVLIWIILIRTMVFYLVAIVTVPLLVVLVVYLFEVPTNSYYVRLISVAISLLVSFFIMPRLFNFIDKHYSGTFGTYGESDTVADASSSTPPENGSTFVESSSVPPSRLTRFGRWVTKTDHFRKKVHEAFDKMDDNGDGGIDKQELFTGMLLLELKLSGQVGPAACWPPARAVCDNLFEEADVNNSGKLDRHQFEWVMGVVCFEIFAKVALFYVFMLGAVPFLGTLIVNFFHVQPETTGEKVVRVIFSLFALYAIMPLGFHLVDAHYTRRRRVSETPNSSNSPLLQNQPRRNIV